MYLLSDAYKIGAVIHAII